METLQLAQPFATFFDSKNRTLRREDFREFLNKEFERSETNRSNFQHSDSKITKFRSGEPVDESFARAFAMFVVELSTGDSEFAVTVLNESSKYDYSWVNDLAAPTIESVMEHMFVPAHTPAFSGSFVQAVHQPISAIHDLALGLGTKLFRLNENHAFVKDRADALATSQCMNRTFGSHYLSPKQKRMAFNEELCLQLAADNWSYTHSLDTWDELYVRWFEIVPHAHVWAVKGTAKQNEDPWSVRVSNLSTLPIREDVYYKIRAGILGVTDLTDPSFFQLPTGYFFIVGAAENFEVSINRLQKSIAEMSCILSQFARMVPSQNHSNYRTDIHLLSFGGSKVTDHTLKSKGFKPLNDNLKEAKEGCCRLFEYVMSDNNYALGSVRDEVYRYQSHLYKSGVLPDEYSSLRIPPA